MCVDICIWMCAAFPSFILLVLCEAMNMFQGIKWSVTKVSPMEMSYLNAGYNQGETTVCLFDFPSLDAK